MISEDTGYMITFSVNTGSECNELILGLGKLKINFPGQEFFMIIFTVKLPINW